MNRDKVLLTTIPSDSHGWNLVFMQMFLQERGWPVLNLGTCVPFEMVLEHCREEEVGLVVVSTINGHGSMEGAELARRVHAAFGEERPLLAIGGKVGVSTAEEAAHAAELRRAGYDGVFHGPSALDEFVSFLGRELPVRAAEEMQEAR
jgi:methylaspartate mutase sigma subunit